MKAYKKLSTARKNSNGKSIIRVGDLFIVGADRLTSIDVIRDDGYITATVTASKLDRMGNGNYATPKRILRHSGTAFNN